MTSAGNGKVGWATRDDYAQAAAAVLTGSGHENTVYELSGTPKTYEEFAYEIAKVLERDVPVQKVDDETFASIISGAGLPEFVVSMLVGIQGAIKQGSLDVESNDLQTLLGRSATPLSEAIASLLKEQRPTV